jgi:hypothetical protein
LAAGDDAPDVGKDGFTPGEALPALDDAPTTGHFLATPPVLAAGEFEVDVDGLRKLGAGNLPGVAAAGFAGESVLAVPVEAAVAVAVADSLSGCDVFVVSSVAVVSVEAAASVDCDSVVASADDAVPAGLAGDDAVAAPPIEGFTAAEGLATPLTASNIRAHYK